MRRYELGSEIESISIRITLLARIVEQIEQSVSPPILCHLEGFGPSFRYAAPTRIHLIFLKLARIVSSLNACTFLLAKGFTQEIGALLRTIIDFESTIKLLSQEDELDENTIKYVDAYFSNFNPTKRNEAKKLPRQKNIHESIEKSMLKNIEEEIRSERFEGKQPSELMSNVYLIFSDYIHGRYPVLMDMFSGTPARIGMYGQPNSPKDRENLECIKTVLTGVELSVRLMLQRLKLQNLLAGDKALEQWYSGFSKS